MADEDILNGHHDFEIFGDDSSKIKTLAFKFDGNVTDIVLCDYRDKQFLVLSQYEKIGSLILVVKGSVRNLSGVTETFDVKTISGVDSQDYHLAARYLAEQLQIVKPVLFGICLKVTSLPILKAIVKVLKDNQLF